MGNYVAQALVNTITGSLIYMIEKNKPIGHTNSLENLIMYEVRGITTVPDSVMPGN